MATIYDSLTAEQVALIAESPLFFIASADPDLTPTPAGLGPVNLSPKGGVPLHVIGPNQVAFLDYPGSGNETARHAAEGAPVTVMVCSFASDDAGIVRLYGKASVMTLDDCPFASTVIAAPAAELTSRPRQVISIDIEHTQTSCGYGVPVLKHDRDRRNVDRGRRFKDT
ncbi:MAG: pyridoxamine 5'-phosphate oxidase family protein [Chromatiales bacterium]|nr:pyridoxamine 5'-phosphate oxidase family protein [Chromatiales bacterium]